MNIPKEAVKIFKELGINGKEATWDCHGTPVVLHKYIEVIAAKLNVSITSLDIVEANTKEGIVSMKCIASIEIPGERVGELIGEDSIRQVISYGECSPKNNKNSYPYAMAEKRAVDRCVLKLANLHGFVYSENEIDAKGIKSGKGAHSPIQDSLKELSTSELAKANSVSILMTKAHRDGNVEEARRLFYDNGLINEVKSGIWELLQSNSKCRSAVSALQTTRRI